MSSKLEVSKLRSLDFFEWTRDSGFQSRSLKIYLMRFEEHDFIVEAKGPKSHYIPLSLIK
jgi:hypothetical protein